MENPKCKIEDPEQRKRIQSILENGPSEYDFRFSVEHSMEPPTAPGLIAGCISAFFRGPGKDKAYETNALAEAMAPTMAGISDLKEMLGSARKYPILQPYTSKGQAFTLFGRVCRRTVWSSKGVAEARRNGNTSVQVIAAGKRPKERKHIPEKLKEEKDMVRHLEDQGFFIVAPEASLDGMVNHLKDQGYTITAPGETVKAVDKPDISRHPQAGYSKAVCGECGGTGHVYLKKEQP